MQGSVVVMGVAGCGKSTVGETLSHALGLPLVEGDDFHSTASRDKMNRGIALTDVDRDGWLHTLASELRRRPQGAVLTCSALKRSYRERLRAASPGLRFVFLDIARDEAVQRVAARAGAHFFSASLVDSQFATLESPAGEAGVLRLDAMQPIETLRDQASGWLQTQETR
jgi:gluconokinase